MPLRDNVFGINNRSCSLFFHKKKISYMKIAIQVFCFAIIPLAFCLGQGQQATLLDNWHDDSITPTSAYNNRYNECWGFAINGHEYGVLGSTAGLHIVDVTDPTDVFEAFRVGGASSGPNVIHRDMKDYHGYLYCVADEGPSKLQIIDLHNLPNSVNQVYSSNEFVMTAHNLYIDTAQAKLYLLGASGQMKILSIADPEHPSLVGTYPNPTFSLPYVHDAFIENNIGFFNCGGSGLWIVDFSDPNNPVTLSTLTSYTDAGYNHSGWKTPDGNYYILCDETHGAKVKILDISDLTDPTEVATIEPGIWNDEIPHNVITRGNYAYFSYYYDGLEVWDISNPVNPQRAYYYDTYTAPNVPSYAGAWGVNPNLPSGNILISDMQGGLFVFAAVDGLPNFNIIPSQDEFSICADETINFSLTVGNGYTSPVSLSVGSGSLPADVQFTPNPAPPGSTVQVAVSNADPTGGLPETLTIVASDGVEGNISHIDIAVSQAPNAPSQTIPVQNASGVAVNAGFEWTAVAEATSYKLQIADDLAAFDSHIVYSANTAATSFTLANNLSAGKTYYWRVNAKNNCGQTASAIRTFTTEVVNAVSDLEGISLSVFPNPANDFLHINCASPIAKAISVTLLNATGQQVLVRNISIGETNLALPLSGLPSGIYFLKMATDQSYLMQKIAVE